MAMKIGEGPLGRVAPDGRRARPRRPRNSRGQPATIPSAVNLLVGVEPTLGRGMKVTRYISYTSGTGATQTAEVAGINTTSATLPCAGNYGQTQADVTATCVQTTFAPSQDEVLSSTTTTYLAGEALFSVGSVTASGFIRAQWLY